MRLIVVHGLPAVGKLTVARELAQLSGWRLFHNHLVVDALLAVFKFGSPPFIELRERMWFEVFAAASRDQVEGLIFTFNPETTISDEFLPRLTKESSDRDDELVFVELTCAESEIERRLSAPSRHSTQKLTSLELYQKLRREGTFDRPVMPASPYTFATDNTSPRETAVRIWSALNSVTPSRTG